MKKTLLIFSILILSYFKNNAQNVNIPDVNFKAYLVGNSVINTNSDSEIQVSEATAFTGPMKLLGNYGITDFTGIEAFVNLTELEISGENMTTLDLSQNTALIKIGVTVNNSLTSINVSQCSVLEELYVSDNNLNALDVSQNTALINLSLFNNNLNSLDVSQNTALEWLNCHNNNLNTIDISQNLALKKLFVSQNNLTQLDLTQHTMLTHLNCSDNNLTHLDLSQNASLVQIACHENNLSSLILKNISPNNSTFFNASSNPNLTCIEVDDISSATTNWANIDSTASFSLDCNYSLSINEYELAKNIFIFPNPVKSIININSSEIIESISITDVLGKVVKSNITSKTTINVSNISKGVYFLQLFTDKGLVSKKFIKD